jgi:release factor glutamine methyltransferase
MRMETGYRQLKMTLANIYPLGEAARIAEMVMEKVSGLRRSARLSQPMLEMNTDELEQYEKFTEELLTYKPVQYVLNEAFFYESDFYVDENVLIPRSETEELVEWIIETIQSRNFGTKVKIQNIIDIGTGSGCIPVSIKNKIAELNVHAIDISEAALEVAKKNAEILNTEIHFQQLDILNEDDWKKLPTFDIIASNPPYIKQSEAEAMNKNVLAFEPHIALFVEDDDALLFYKAIMQFAKQKLNENGLLFFEVNESLGNETKRLLEENGFVAELKKDMQQKERMIKASKNL